MDRPAQLKHIWQVHDLLAVHLFGSRADDGHRVAATDSEEADPYELAVMPRVAELLPIDHQLEQDFFPPRTS